MGMPARLHKNSSTARAIACFGRRGAGHQTPGFAGLSANQPLVLRAILTGSASPALRSARPLWWPVRRGCRAKQRHGHGDSQFKKVRCANHAGGCRNVVRQFEGLAGKVGDEKHQKGLQNQRYGNQRDVQRVFTGMVLP